MLAVRIIVSCLYALLMIVALLARRRQAGRLDVPMLAGAALVLAANCLGRPAALLVAIAGLLAMHAAALINGRRGGKIHLSHHLVRLVVSVGIGVLFYLS